MMLVPTYLDKSSIHGMGIFARDFIAAGTRVWEFTGGCDQVYPADQLAALTPLQRETILFYGYIEPGIDGVVLCCDNARHFNFADNPNCGSGDHVVQGYVSTFALSDIAAGSEMTYSVDDDADAARKLSEG